MGGITQLGKKIDLGNDVDLIPLTGSGNASSYRVNFKENTESAEASPMEHVVAEMAVTLVAGAMAGHIFGGLQLLMEFAGEAKTKVWADLAINPKHQLDARLAMLPNATSLENKNKQSIYFDFLSFNKKKDIKEDVKKKNSFGSRPIGSFKR